MFDEMHVNSRICYDSEDDVNLGPSGNLQVAIVRDITSEWNQPIYYIFDSKTLLLNIISEIQGHSYCFWFGGSTRKLWNDLEVNFNQTYFVNLYFQNDKI